MFMKNLKPKCISNLYTKNKDGSSIVHGMNKIYQMNPISTEIWDKLDGNNSIHDIVTTISRKYNEKYDTVNDDVLEILVDWHNNKNLIILDYNPLFKLGTENKSLKLELNNIYISNTGDFGKIDILFILPPTSHILSNVMKGFTAYSPVGVGYLYTLMDKNFSVKIGLLNLWNSLFDKAELINILEALNPEITAFSAMTSTFLNGARIASIIKSINKDTTTLFGGPHVSVNYEEALQNKDIDVCFISEAEYSFLEFMKYFLQHDENWRTVKGIAYRKDNDIVFTGPPDLTKINLDDLPYPKFNRDRQSGYEYYPIITARGCPFSCKFCAAGMLSHNRYRIRSTKSIVDEIEYLYKNDNIQTFTFLDDTATFMPERIEEICNELIYRKIKLKWSAESRIDFGANYPHLLKLMNKAGCYTLQYGIESGDNEKLKEINKKSSRELIYQAMQNTAKLDIQIVGSFIISIPEETLESMQQTYDFAKELQEDYNVFSTVSWFVPFPGTYYERNLSKYKVRTKYLNEYDQYHTIHPIVLREDITDEEALNFHYANSVKLMIKNTEIMPQLKRTADISILNNKNKYEIRNKELIKSI